MVYLCLGAKPFTCTHCDKKFRTTGHLKNHLISHIKGQQKDPAHAAAEASLKRLEKDELPDIPMQEPILITDTGRSITQVCTPTEI